MIASHNGEPSAFDRVEVIFNPPSTGTVSQMAEQLRTNLSQRLPTMPVQLSPTERAGHGRELAQTVPRVLAQQSDLEDHGLMTPASKICSHQPSLLAVYLNDHLGGATGGLELVRRTARAHRDSAAGDALRHLAAQVSEDRRTLLAIMRTLGVPVHRYKIALGYLAEKAARLKPNGRMLRRSPLSSVVELEALRLGIMGKAAGWVVLRMRADSDPRLDAGALDDLITRATRQAATVEELRVRAAAEAFN